MSSIRWRESEINDAIEKELAGVRLPERHARWFRNALEAIFSEVGTVQAERGKFGLASKT